MYTHPEFNVELATCQGDRYIKSKGPYFPLLGIFSPLTHPLDQYRAAYDLRNLVRAELFGSIFA